MLLNFPSSHAKALERRIAVIPCEYYVEKADPDLIEKLQDEKKEIFLYLMYVYKQIVKMISSTSKMIVLLKFLMIG